MVESSNSFHFLRSSLSEAAEIEDAKHQSSISLLILNEKRSNVLSQELEVWDKSLIPSLFLAIPKQFFKLSIRFLKPTIMW
jgi:hypothetical protein